MLYFIHATIRVDVCKICEKTCKKGDFNTYFIYIKMMMLSSVLIFTFCKIHTCIIFKYIFITFWEFWKFIWWFIMYSPKTGPNQVSKHDFDPFTIFPMVEPHACWSDSSKSVKKWQKWWFLSIFMIFSCFFKNYQNSKVCNFYSALLG